MTVVLLIAFHSVTCSACEHRHTRDNKQCIKRKSAAVASGSAALSVSAISEPGRVALSISSVDLQKARFNASHQDEEI